MSHRFGWAAFWACLILLAPLPANAQAVTARPSFACFDVRNALALDRLGPGDPSVRYGFETGECLALGRQVRVIEVTRTQGVWRFRAFGGRPFLYAADWAAGLDSNENDRARAFEQFLPVSSRLLVDGREFVQCADAFSRLRARIQDHEARWRTYWSSPLPRRRNTAVFSIIYVDDTGPQLSRERGELERESVSLDRRCAGQLARELDDDFIQFIRTARLT